MLRNILLDRTKTGAYIYIYAYIYTYMYVANRRKQQHEMWVCLNNYPKTATFNKAYDDKPTSTHGHLHLPHRLITKKERAMKNTPYLVAFYWLVARIEESPEKTSVHVT